MRTLQIGMGWLPEQPGNGLDRVYKAIIQHLPDVDVSVNGLVAGSSAVSTSSHQQVQAVAPTTASLPGRLWAFRRSVQDSLTTHSPDLVAAHFALYAAPALDSLSKHPFIMHFHGPWAYESSAEGESAWKVNSKAMLEQVVYKRADRFIVLSSAFRDLLVARYNVDPTCIRLVPGGVNTDRFALEDINQRAARERLGWPTDRPIILSVRRLVRRVGLDRLINAIDIVRRHESDVVLYIAGKGPLQDELEQQIHDRDLAEHAKLLGFVPDDDLPYAYRAADLSVVPTIAHEGFGLIVVESLAAGTPVLATPVGGLPEIVSELSDTLLLPDAQPHSIATRIIDVLDGTLPLPGRSACQHYIQGRYDWPTIAHKVRTVYEELL